MAASLLSEATMSDLGIDPHYSEKRIFLVHPGLCKLCTGYSKEEHAAASYRARNAGWVTATLLRVYLSTTEYPDLFLNTVCLQQFSKYITSNRFCQHICCLLVETDSWCSLFSLLILLQSFCSFFRWRVSLCSHGWKLPFNSQSLFVIFLSVVVTGVHHHTQLQNPFSYCSILSV